ERFGVAARHLAMLMGEHAPIAHERHGAGAERGIDGQDDHRILHASSKSRRPARGRTLFGSPKPMLQRKFDLMAVPEKNALSTPSWLNPPIGPQSRPIARAAMMK